MLSPELLHKIQHIYIKSQRLVSEVFAGEYVSAFRGRGMEFEEVRAYMPGDEIRSIDWNVTARMDHPYIKVFHEEREQTVMLLVDASASVDFGSLHRTKREVLTEIAAVLAYAAIKSNDKVGLLIFSDRVERYIPPKKGRGHVWRVISEILHYQPKGKGTDLKGALEYLGRVVRRKSVCFILSDFLNGDGFRAALRVTGLKHEVVALVVNDPVEAFFPAGAFWYLEDSETGQARRVDLKSMKRRQQYAIEQQKRMEGIKRRFQEMRLDFLFLTTAADYIHALLLLFRMRERRRSRVRFRSAS